MSNKSSPMSKSALGRNNVKNKLSNVKNKLLAATMSKQSFPMSKKSSSLRWRPNLVCLICNVWCRNKVCVHVPRRALDTLEGLSTPNALPRHDLGAPSPPHIMLASRRRQRGRYSWLLANCSAPNDLSVAPNDLSVDDRGARSFAPATFQALWPMLPAIDEAITHCANKPLTPTRADRTPRAAAQTGKLTLVRLGPGNLHRVVPSQRRLARGGPW